jgi:hypothetical protein
MQFLICFPKNDQFPFLKIIRKKGCKHVLLKEEGQVLASSGLEMEKGLKLPIEA